MKVRNGFVSNSSSSSFIVGVAEIADKAKFDAYLEAHNIVIDDYKLHVVDGDYGNDWSINVGAERVRVESFETSVSIDAKKRGTMYFTVNIANNEGDSPFWSEQYSEMDYDIDIEYFSDREQRLYSMFSDSASGLNIDNADVRYGAARNG